MDMSRTCLLTAFFSLVCIAPSIAQVFITETVKNEGEQQLTEELSLPEIESGWCLYKPNSEVQGVFVRFHLNTDSVKEIYDKCEKHDFAVIYIGTNYRLEFLFEDELKRELALQLKEIVEEYDLPGDRLFFAGMSLEGHRAVLMSQFLELHPEYGMKCRALAICDAPLDWLRFYRSTQGIKERDVHPKGVNEARWVSAYLERNLNGTPTESIENYYQFSSFCYEARDSSKLDLNKRTALRAYTEPDVHWWMENRGQDYYDMNAIDAAAFVNALSLIGNKEVELITTQGKGYIEDHERHPHSWSIVDEDDLLKWLSELP